MQFTRRETMLAAAAALVLSSPAFGEDADQPMEIAVTTPVKHADPMGMKRANASDTARLLDDQPGVSLNTGGGVSSLPAIHGLADDRIKLLVDGMQITSACANHMNPALSYIAPASVSGIGVLSGLTPVSAGGDSIAGTISISSPEPVFAEPGQTRSSGSISGFYRSVNKGTTAAATAEVANDRMSLAYAGSQDKASSYKDGHGNLVRDTLFHSSNQ